MIKRLSPLGGGGDSFAERDETGEEDVVEVDFGLEVGDARVAGLAFFVDVSFLPATEETQHVTIHRAMRAIRDMNGRWVLVFSVEVCDAHGAEKG